MEATPSLQSWASVLGTASTTQGTAVSALGCRIMFPFLVLAVGHAKPPFSNISWDHRAARSAGAAKSGPGRGEALIRLQAQGAALLLRGFTRPWRVSCAADLHGLCVRLMSRQPTAG